MNTKYFALLSIIVFGYCSVSSSAVLTDEDLERYKKGGTVIDNQTVQKKDHAAPKKSKNMDRQRWCDEGEKYRKQIAKAQEDIKQADRILEEQQSVFPITNKKIKSAQKKKLKAEKDLKEAQAKLDALEDKAHRNSVPPGWVRCQFDY
ncbi:MAG: hypothetical protein LLF86_01310 [Nitrospiraceae bacterium]|nr:hypothetical protein [Nitrospiraceae bacterium]